MSKPIHFGDQIYIEISNLGSSSTKDVCLLCPNGLFDKTIFGARTGNYLQSNFKSCVFTLIPGLTETKDEIYSLKEMKTELSFLSKKKANTFIEKYLMNELSSNEKQTNRTNGNVSSLNEKILLEMDGQNIYFGDVVILQHLESGYYLCAESIPHPSNPTLQNLKLCREKSRECYFKFASYSASTEEHLVDFQTEIKLVSLFLNTVVKMGPLNKPIDGIGFTLEDNEGLNEENSFFPADPLRREIALKSFSGTPMAIGTTLESDNNKENDRVRLVEYCSKEALTSFQNNKTIKNGDYVRFQIDEFYLTASKGSDRSYRDSLGLVSQNYESYNFNITDTIFQMVVDEEEEENPYPKANEVQTTTRKIDHEDSTDLLYLKHFMTGQYLSAPEDVLSNPRPNIDRALMPSFNLIHNSSVARAPLIRNSKIGLQFLNQKDDFAPRFYQESDIEMVNNEQPDMETHFFLGFKNTDDKIDWNIKRTKKKIIGDPDSESAFKVIKVEEDEMKLIMKLESVANTFRHFIRVIQSITRHNGKVSLATFRSELARISESSKKVLSLLKSKNKSQTQNLIREFRIIDMTIRLFFYLTFNNDFQSGLSEIRFESKSILSLIGDLQSIIQDSIQENQLCHIYASQYIRVFINSLLDQSPLFPYGGKDSDTLKGIVADLLIKFLDDKDTLKQFSLKQYRLFEALNTHKSNSLYLLKVLNHYFNNNLLNSNKSLEKNFINNYIANENRMLNIFPKISSFVNKHGDPDFKIVFEKDSSGEVILLNDSSPEIQKYLSLVFELIVTLSKQNSKNFSQIMSNFYSERFCVNIIQSPKVAPELKNNVLEMKKAIHHAYNEIPFIKTPSMIHIIKDQEAILEWRNLFRLKELQVKNGTSETEGSIQNPLHKFYLNILKEGLEKIKGNKFDSFSFTLTVMNHFLTEVEEDEKFFVEGLYYIHSCLRSLIGKATPEPKEKKMEGETEENLEKLGFEVWDDNIEKIFSVLSELESKTVKLAFKELLKNRRNRGQRSIEIFLRDLEKDKNFFNPTNKYEDKDDVSEILDSWRNKKRIYLSDFGSLDGADMDDLMIKNLLKISQVQKDAANMIVPLIKAKANFEVNVREERSKCVIITEDNGIRQANQLVQSLLDLKSIDLTLRARKKASFDYEEESIISNIVQHFETIFLMIYDYNRHLQHTGSHFKESEARNLFMDLFTHSKMGSREELPFVYKECCIKPDQQRLLRILKAHEILLPFIRHLLDMLGTEMLPSGSAIQMNLKYAYRLLLVIFITFLYNDPTNQDLMASFPEFTSIFSNELALEASIETRYSFAEMCRNNTNLLALNEKVLYDAACDFAAFFDKMNTKEFGNSMYINYIRSLPIIFASHIPEDIFRPSVFIEKHLKDFHNFIVSNSEISLLTLIPQIRANNHHKNDRISNSNEILHMPILYAVLRESLESHKMFAMSEAREEIIKVQNSFTLETIQKLIRCENIEFNFDLKRLSLQVIQNAFFKNRYKNLNVFLDYEQFSSFISTLLIDVHEYISYHKGRKLTKIFDLPIFYTQENLDLREKYQTLSSFDLKKTAFLLCQSLLLFEEIWKEYVYFIMFDLFSDLLAQMNFTELQKQEEFSGQKIFEIWIELALELRTMSRDDLQNNLPDEDDKNKLHNLDHIDKFLIRIVSYPEYMLYEDKIYSVVEKPNKKAQTSLAFSSYLKTYAPHNFDPLHEIIWSKKPSSKVSNENDISGFIPENNQRKLFVNMLYSKKKEDTLFMLRSLTNLLEAQNKKKEEEDQKKKEELQGNPPKNDTQNHTKALKEAGYLSGNLFKSKATDVSKEQESLREAGIVKAIFDLFYRFQKDKTMLKHILFFCNKLLAGGNRPIQDEFYAQFQADQENYLVFSIMQFLREALYELKITESRRVKESYTNAFEFTFCQLSDFNPIIGLADQLGEKKEELAQEFYKIDKAAIEEAETEDTQLLELILEFLQSLCEGHHSNFQAFLHNQTFAGVSKSSDIPAFLIQAYHDYYKYLNISNIDIGMKILNVLIEIQQQTSQKNTQVFLKKTFIMDLCNVLTEFNSHLELLARGFGDPERYKRFLEFKSKVIALLKDIIERLEPSDLEKIAQYIDVKSLLYVFKESILAFNDKIHEYRGRYSLKTNYIGDPNISRAFNVFFILKHLSFGESLGDFTDEINKGLQEISEGELNGIKIDNENYIDFLKRNTGSIEIFEKRLDKLIKIYFPLPKIYFYLRDDAKEKFEEEVDRRNTPTKVIALLEASRELIRQAYMNYTSKQRILGINAYDAYTVFRILANVISLAVVFVNIFGLEYDSESETIYYKHDRVQDANLALNCVVSVIVLILMLLWLHTRLGKYLASTWAKFIENQEKTNMKKLAELDRVFEKDNISDPAVLEKYSQDILDLKGPYSYEWQYVEKFMTTKLAYRNFLFVLQSKLFIWHIIYLGVCIGSIFHPICTAFQLFDIAIRSDAVNRTTQAFSRNVKQFFWTLFLLLITIYTYTMIGFYALHKRYYDDDIQDFCKDAYSCYLSTLNQGLRSGGGIADALQKVEYDKDDKGKFFLHTLFDLTFFIIMITLLLNLIFGMIIDAFGDLRDEKTANEDDKENVCFICGLPRSEYERAGDFDKHTQEEHNLWFYVAYLMYLAQKRHNTPTELTDIEDYVVDRENKKDLAWIPIGRSLVLEQLLAKEEKDVKSEIDKLGDKIANSFEQVVSRFDKLMEQNEKIDQQIEANHELFKQITRQGFTPKAGTQKMAVPKRASTSNNNH